MFIVEGKSAASALQAVRNRDNQAILPMQGKLVNSRKKSPRLLLDNPHIRVLLQSIRADSSDTFDKVALRYKRLIILTDADIDGMHARSLIVLLFYLHMPWVVESNSLFAVYPPLYGLHSKVLPNPRYAITQRHRNELLAQLAAKGVSNIDTVHYKGVASLQSAALATECVHPETRTIRQIGLADCAGM